MVGRSSTMILEGNQNQAVSNGHAMERSVGEVAPKMDIGPTTVQGYGSSRM